MDVRHAGPSYYVLLHPSQTAHPFHCLTDDRPESERILTDTTSLWSALEGLARMSHQGPR